MKYLDGKEMRVGDSVLIEHGTTPGVIELICETQAECEEINAEEVGVLLKSPPFGLVYLPTSTCTYDPIVFVARSTCGAEQDHISLADLERNMKIIQGDLSTATNEVERFYALNRGAKNALQAGNALEAETLANELAHLAPKYTNDWNYGNAIQDVNQVLGRIALSKGNVAEAKKRLLASADSKGSPQMNSFGPNMQLAKALLEKGERDVVLTYFQHCSKFWKMGTDQLATWTTSVKNGDIPDFGPNLKY